MLKHENEPYAELQTKRGLGSPVDAGGRGISSLRAANPWIMSQAWIVWKVPVKVGNAISFTSLAFLCQIVPSCGSGSQGVTCCKTFRMRTFSQSGRLGWLDFRVICNIVPMLLMNSCLQDLKSQSWSVYFWGIFYSWIWMDLLDIGWNVCLFDGFGMGFWMVPG